MIRRLRTPAAVVLAFAGLLALPAHSAPPATSPPEEQPAVSTQIQQGGIGTTIVGEQDAAVGLYITPWKEESASDLDRPPSLYDAPPAAVDAQGFSRRARYFDAAQAHRAERLQRNN